VIFLHNGQEKKHGTRIERIRRILTAFFKINFYFVLRVRFILLLTLLVLKSVFICCIRSIRVRSFVFGSGSSRLG